MQDHQAEQADLAAQAQPLQEQNLLDVAVGNIPLPPAELRDQLDNSDVAESEADEAPVEETVTLDFFGDELPEHTHRLRFPFRWEGRKVEEVKVRMLTTAELGRIVAQANKAQRMPDRIELYAAMTGLPVKVLRAMPSVDGDPIIDKAFDFLPPLFRAEGG